MIRSGGCQCGAVRFRVAGELGRASICHCRMCQKATGGFFGPYVSTAANQTTWTRGAPKYFQSSNAVRRGFCGDCGTPLTFEGDWPGVDLCIGAFDDPTEIAPVIQIGLGDKLPFVDGLAGLPGDQPRVAGHFARIVSNQHPDHDT